MIKPVHLDDDAEEAADFWHCAVLVPKTDTVSSTNE
jgi:hypothetical protein